MPYIGKTPTVGNFQVCDAISVVNGQAAYTLQVGGVNVAPESANHMLVSLNGILQKPGSSFTISGSTMTFASNLATGDVIDFVQILGNVLDIGQPSDDTVTAAKLNDDIISGQTALTSEPADTDEFLVSDAGTIKRIDYSLIKGGGKVLQVVEGVSTSQVQTTNTSYTQGNLELNITPSATSSKILVMTSFNGATSQGNQTAFFTIYRDSTNLSSNDMAIIYDPSNSGDELRIPVSMQVLDSPSTTSQITYEVYFKINNGSHTATVNPGPKRGSIIAMEIGA